MALKDGEAIKLTALPKAGDFVSITNAKGDKLIYQVKTVGVRTTEVKELITIAVSCEYTGFEIKGS